MRPDASNIAAPLATKSRSLVSLATLSLLVVFVAASVSTIKSALENTYLSHGFLRTVLFDFELAVTTFLWPAVGFTTALAFVVLLSGRRGHGFRALRICLAALPAVAYFLRQGYLTNRFRFSGMWLGNSREMLGVPVPEALFHLDVWLTNGLITLIALGMGGAIWLVLGKLGEDRLGRWWRGAGRALPAISAVLLLAIPLIVAAGLRPSLDERPSFILVSLDTLRADHLSLYGYGRETSPELERLAEESVVFEWAMSQAPNTSHSHMSIFTSQYPTAHGFRGERDQLAGFWNTLPEYLREAGYRTAATTDGGLMRGWYGYEQGFEEYRDERLQGLERSVARVFDWLDAGLADSPFFLFVHTYDVHTPYVPPKPYRGLFTDEDYSGGFYPGSEELEAIRRRVGADPSSGHGLSDDDIQFIKGRYDEGIRYTDDVMGRFVDGLRSRGVLDEAWLIITADHGEEFTEHGSVLHEKLYHSVLHVPLIVRPPGGVEARTVGEIVELIDIMPTILDLAKVPVPDRLQGSSLAGLLEGNTEGWKNVAYAEHPWFGMRRSVTSKEFHFLTSLENGETELYRYTDDRAEQVHLDAEEYAKVREELKRRVLEWSDEQIATRTPDGTLPLRMDQKALEELKALGYIQ